MLCAEYCGDRILNSFYALRYVVCIIPLTPSGEGQRKRLPAKRTKEVGVRLKFKQFSHMLALIKGAHTVCKEI